MSNTATILIVDDEEDLLEMLKFEFDFQGFQVVLATGGDDAFQRFEASAPDVILSDIRMPHGDGIGLLKKIREKSSEVPFFFMSGYSEISEEEALSIGAQAYFVKPFDLPDVVEKIKASIAFDR